VSDRREWNMHLAAVRRVRVWWCAKGLSEYHCWQATHVAPVEYSGGHEKCHEE
jgi:hypothetical protein